MEKFLDKSGLARFWYNIKAYLTVCVPSGIICAWAGSSSDIPSGWCLCDGTNGTPDLQDKFVLGSGTTHSVGETGGSEEVTLTEAQMPSHKHTENLPKPGGAASQSFWRFSATSGSSIGLTIKDSADIIESRSDFSTKAVSTYGAGSSQPHPNMPPYYTLCYIMKL